MSNNLKIDGVNLVMEDRAVTEIEKILSVVQIPDIVKVRQIFPKHALENVSETLTQKLVDKNIDIKPGQRIAITCGSRGIDNYTVLVKTIVDFVKSKGGQPVLIPAMGSHGGATAKGQAEVLERYGITEKTMGAPVLSSMEVVQIGTTDVGLPVYIDKNAYECDGIIILNRVKCHTAFRGKVESGLTKMLAIGLAKQKGAEMTHALGFDNMGKNILKVGEIALSKLNIICGVASIEDSSGSTAEVHVVYGNEIPEEEPKMLVRANEYMARFYVDQADALIIQSQGKEISGSGYDSNIIGRYNTPTHLGGPRFTAMGVLDLSDESENNANGMGAADFASRRFYNKIDFEKSYVNCLTSLAIFTNKMPVILETDKLVVQAAVKFSGKPDRSKVSLIFARDTKHIEYIYMSKAAIECVPEKFKNSIEVIGDFFPVPFDDEGNLILF